MANEYQYDPLAGAARAFFEQGFGMGWGDEAEAAARAKISGRTPEEELADIKREYAAYSAAHPVASTALEFAGGALPSVLATLIPGGQLTAPAAVTRLVSPLARLGSAVARQPVVRDVVGGLSRTGNVLADMTGYGKTVAQRSLGQNVGRAMVTSGTQGAVGGAGASEGSRTAGAIIGGGAGSVLGPAFVLAPGAAGAAGRWISQYWNATEKEIEAAAARRLARGLGVSPAEMEAQIASDRAMGVPSTPMNVSRESVGTADILAQRPGESQRIIGEAIGSQREGARDRLSQQVQQGLAPTNYYATRDSLQNSLRRNANDVYQKAYEFGSVDDPVIMEMLKVPQFKAAFDRAQSISRLEQAAAKARGEDPSQFSLQSVYRSTGNFDPELMDALEKMGIPADKIPQYLSRMGDDAMQMEEVLVPDVRTLDYIKRGLDSIIDSGFRGEGMSIAEARALKDLRNTFVSRLDEVVPDYGVARRKYAGDLEVLEALDTGYENFNKLDPEEISGMWRGFSDAEKDAFRTGAARQLWGAVMDPSAEADYAKRIIGSPSTRSKLRTIFPSDATYELFEAALKRESDLFKNASTILAGSATARRQAGMEAFEADPLLDAAAVLTAQGFERGIVNGVLNMFSKGRVSDSVAKKMAEWLTADDPQKVAAVVAALEKFAAEQAPRTTRRIGASAGVAGGTLGAGFPAPERTEEYQ